MRKGPTTSALLVAMGLNPVYPRLRVRRSQATAKWYVVLQVTYYHSELITRDLTFNQARRIIHILTTTTARLAHWNKFHD